MVYLTRDFNSYNCSLLRKKVKNSPALTMTRKCEKLQLRFCRKVVLHRNKLKPWFPKTNCLCELTLELFSNLSAARPEVLAKFELKP